MCLLQVLMGMLCMLADYTENGERLAGLNFHGFRGF